MAQRTNVWSFSDAQSAGDYPEGTPPGASSSLNQKKSHLKTIVGAIVGACITANCDHLLVPPAKALARRGTEHHTHSQRGIRECQSNPILSQSTSHRDITNFIGRPSSIYRGTASSRFRRHCRLGHVNWQVLRSIRPKHVPETARAALSVRDPNHA